MKELYKTIDHTADLGIELEAETLKDLFEKAALSLTHLILGEIPEQQEKAETYKVEIKGEDLSDLMMNWLSEVLYLFEGEKKITCGLHIDYIDSKRLTATLTLIRFDERKHEAQYEIKAVTYHQLDVTKKDGHWKARVIFDV